jgi:hypothetical protein
LEKRVDIEQRKIVVLDFDNLVICGGIDDGCDLGAIKLKLLCLLDDVWETCEDELVDVWLTAVDDLLQHSDDHFSWDDPIALNHLMHFDTNGCLSLVLISDKSIDVEINETV